MNNPDVAVTVIVPVYNAENYLSQCLDSILAQTINRLEIICVDDGSSDGSLRILEEYAECHEQILILRQSNQGAGVARNKALSVAKGKFVMFMDADDWYPSNVVLETLYNKACNNHVCVCGGSFSEYRDGIYNETYTGTNACYTFTEEKRMDYRDFQFDYGYIRFMYDLEFLRKYNICFPAYKRFQDPPFFVNVMVHAKEFYAVPIVAYCYRKSENKVQWTNEKINDAVRGLTDNLRLSSKYGLEKLHTITVERLNREYLKIIIRHMGHDNLRLLTLLVEASEAVNPGLLNMNGYNVDVSKTYVLKALRQFCFAPQAELRSVRASASYRIGRIITFIPRKLRSLFRRLKTMQ